MLAAMHKLNTPEADKPNVACPPIRVSVVLCTYNRAHALVTAIESLLALRIPLNWEVEVLAVDNGSTDATRHVIADIATRTDGRLRYCFEPRPGVAAARNRGVAEAASDWIAFFDDDQCADPNWLGALVMRALENNVRVVGGAVRLRLPPGQKQLPGAIRRIFGETPNKSEAVRYSDRFAPGTGNLLLHRTVFEDVGVFDPDLIEAGEDTDLYRRIRQAGIEAWFEPDAIVEHIVPEARLQSSELLAASRRVGWGFFRRDSREYNRAKLTAVALARLGKAALVDLPVCAVARLKGDKLTALAAYVDAQRNASYAAAAAISFLTARMRASLGLQPPDFRHETRSAPTA